MTARTYLATLTGDPGDDTYAIGAGSGVEIPPSGGSGITKLAADGYYVHQDGTGLPSSVAVGSSSDVLGRTQVLARGDGVFPALQQSVFVDDAPWNAKGDVKRVADGAITTGTNALSSTSAAFTSADVGKVVEVVGAGTTAINFNLSAYIGSVAGGVASLVTTKGGSTHANAGTTVSGAIVTYGTDDTAAVNAAATALGAAGGGRLCFNHLRNYWFSKHSPVSNVTYDGQGALFYIMPLPADGVNPNQAVIISGLQNITFRNMRWLGHGFEIHNQWPMMISYSSYITVENCRFENLCINGIYFSGVQSVRVVNNQFVSVCSTNPPGTAATGNPVNLNMGGDAANYPMTDIYVAGNSITNVSSEGINITSGSNLNPPQSVPFRARIIGNYVKGNRVSNYQRGIMLELSNGGTSNTYPAEEVTVSSNICEGCGIETQLPALTLGTQTAHIAITGNVITGFLDPANTALIYRGSYATISGNVVKASIPFSVTNYGSGGSMVSVTGDLNSTTTVANVAGAISASVKNGTYVTGSGIPANTYIVSGAGTATWILSQAATATTSGVTINITDPAYGVTVTGNTFRMVAGANTGVQACNLSNAMSCVFASNTILFDPGVPVNVGLYVGNSSWVNINGNMIESPTRFGMFLRSNHDLTVNDNLIHNPAQEGIAHSLLVGAANVFDGNTIVDDRAAPTMPCGISSSISGLAIGANLRIRNNTIVGNTGSAINNFGGQFLGVVEYRNNSSNPVGTSSVAVPATTVAVASTPFDRTFYVTAGASTCTMAIQNGPSPVIPSGGFATIRVPAGKTVTPTFASAPTWLIEGE